MLLWVDFGWNIILYYLNRFNVIIGVFVRELDLEKGIELYKGDWDDFDFWFFKEFRYYLRRKR